MDGIGELPQEANMVTFTGNCKEKVVTAGTLLACGVLIDFSIQVAIVRGSHGFFLILIVS